MPAVRSSQFYSYHIHTTDTTRSEVHDTGTVQNGDITITKEEELNLFPFLGPKQERQPSIRSSKSIKLSSVTTGTKFGRPKRPPVGSFGKLVMVKWHVSLVVSVSLRSQCSGIQQAELYTDNYILW